jgi:hypothetical protein
VANNWRAWVWIACGATIVGALISSVLNGRPAGFNLMIVSVLLLAGALTLGDRVLRALRDRRALPAALPSPDELRSRVSPHRPRSQRTSAAGTTREDWEALARVSSMFKTSQVDWLRTATFVTPWFDENARPVMEIAGLAAALQERPFPEAVDNALRDVSEAAAAFAEFYEAETFPDPLLLGADWRFFDWDHPQAFGHDAPPAELWQGRAATLQRLSTAVAVAYAELVDAASGQPQLRKLIAGAAPSRS